MVWNIEEASVFFILTNFFGTILGKWTRFTCFQNLNFWYWIFTQRLLQVKILKNPHQVISIPATFFGAQTQPLAWWPPILSGSKPFLSRLEKDKIWIQKIEERWKCKAMQRGLFFRDEICHNRCVKNFASGVNFCF